MTEKPEISNAQWQFILPHPTEIKIALMPKDNEWTLPTLPSNVPMNSYWKLYLDGYKVQQLWDWRIAVRYQAKYLQAKAFNDIRIVYALDNLDQHTDLPAGGEWVDEDEAQALLSDDVQIQEIVAIYYQEQTNGIPKYRPPWGQVGWYSQTMDWIKAQLTENDYTLTGDIELMRTWCITSMYKMMTDKGDLYFKAVPPVFKREIAITSWLHEQFGDTAPEFVAYDSDKQLMLMRDFGGTNLYEAENTSDPNLWKAALQQYAKLQMKTTSHADKLIELGAMDWRIDRFLPLFEKLLYDDEFIKPDSSITQEEIEQARQTLPQVTAHIEALQAMNLPNAILHGDFHAGNVNVNDEQFIYYDWTDAGIGIPLFDLHPFINWGVNEVFKDNPDVQDEILEAYFEGLSGDISKETWREAYKHSQVVAIIHHALNYHHLLRQIAPNERWILDIMGNLLKDLVVKVREVGE